MDQPQPDNDQDIPQVADQVEGVPEPYLEHKVPLRQSTRERRPGYVFTYPSLGQPVYQLHLTVNAVEIQPVPVPNPHPILTPLAICHIPNLLLLNCWGKRWKSYINTTNISFLLSKCLKYTNTTWKYLILFDNLQCSEWDGWHEISTY